MILAAEAAPDIPTGWALTAAIVLILLNGLFVAYEFAMIAAKKSAFEQAAAEGRRVASAAVDAMSDLSLQLAGAQLGITMATLGLGYVGEPVLAGVLEGWLGERLSEDATVVASFVIALAVVSFLHLVIGEMVPKNIAIAAPEPTVRWLVLPGRVYLWVFRPVVRLLNALANLVCRAVGVEPRDELHVSHSAAELSTILAVSSAGGEIDVDSAERLRGALRFAERTVGEVARPIEEVSTIRRGATFGAAEAVVARDGVTRVAVRSVTRDDQRVVGYIHAKDLLVPAEQRQQPIPDALHRKMVLVRPSQPLVNVLRMLRQQRLQMALVVDADGPVGIISVEEIIEALTAPVLGAPMESV